MSKIISKYQDNLDRAWYDSSNVVYSECIDKEGELKTVLVTFKNGSTYKYSGVIVSDYLSFREDPSQGKALNRLIKQYECEKVEARDVESLKEEMEQLLQEQRDELNWELECEETENSFILHFKNNTNDTLNFNGMIGVNETDKDKVRKALKILKIIK